MSLRGRPAGVATDRKEAKRRGGRASGTAASPGGGRTWRRPHPPAPHPAEAGSPGPGVTWAIEKAAPGATGRGHERRVAGVGRLQRQERAGAPPGARDQVSQGLWPRGRRVVAKPNPDARAAAWPLPYWVTARKSLPSLSLSALGLLKSPRCVSVAQSNNNFNSPTVYFLFECRDNSLSS